MRSNLENEQYEILALFQNNLSGNSETLSLSGNSGTLSGATDSPIPTNHNIDLYPGTTQNKRKQI